MASVYDQTNALSQGASEVEGLNELALGQEVLFTQYTRWVLPIDGYVFWLRTASMTVKGSLHVDIAKQQNEDETVAVNRVEFSTGTFIEAFNDIDPNKIWVGQFRQIKFAFTQSDDFYKAAHLFNYVGIALLPAFANMLVDTGNQLPATTQVVSNSLPAWLRMAHYNPVWLRAPNPGVTLYPSYAVPDNVRPPYGTVHIEPGETRPLAAMPLLGPYRPVGKAALGIPRGMTPDSSHWQLASDQVRITLYGLTNAQAADFMDAMIQYSLDYDFYGFMSSPVIVDDKRTQAELGILAMKKTISITVSYYQHRMNEAAAQLIKQATATITPRNL